MNYESLLGDGVPFELVRALAELHCTRPQLEDVDGGAITVRSAALSTLRVVDEPFEDETGRAA